MIIAAAAVCSRSMRISTKKKTKNMMVVVQDEDGDAPPVVP